MIVQLGSILLVSMVLFAAPLVLGSHVATDGFDRWIRLAWFGAMSGLLIVALVLGAACVVLNGYL